MWNFFIREVFPYNVEDQIEYFGGFSIFSMCNGTKKGCGEKVSIFIYNKKSGVRPDLTDNARIAAKKLKKFKHPSILTYVDCREDDNCIYLVTNRCLPLFGYLTGLKRSVGKMYLEWGLASIAEAVAFLNSVGLRHNNIFHGSVFVNEQGTWQLGELGYVTSMDSSFPCKLIRSLDRYNPGLGWGTSSLDVWGLGVLLWESFNGELDNADCLQSIKNIPSELQTVYQQLINQQQCDENTISKLICSCRSDNLLSNTLENLNNYHLKEKDVKISISKDLMSLLLIIPKDIILNKILSLINQICEFNDENSSYLIPVIAKISASVTEEEFRTHLEKIVAFLFSSNNRAIRVTLLINIKDIVSKIDKKNLNSLFPLISAGFLDSAPQIRDETVKAMVYLAPRLSRSTLNQEMLRHLIHIQMKDEDPYLRTNATICLANVAYCLEPGTRQNVLLCALLHALNDPVPSVRKAAVKAFAVTHRFFPVDITAKSVLPRLVALTVDQDASVREDAFKSIRALLLKLEEVSRYPQMKEEVEKDVASNTCEESMSWTQWAFAAITGKLLKTAETKQNSDTSDSKGVTESAQTSPKVSPEAEATTPKDMSADRTAVEDKTNEQGWNKECGNVTQHNDVTTTVDSPAVGTRKRPGPMKLGIRLGK